MFEGAEWWFVWVGLLTEDDQVLGDGGMDDIHGAHGTAGVVEHPLLIVVDVGGGLGPVRQLVDNVLDDGAGVVAVGLDAALGQVVEVVRLEDVEGLEALLQEVPDWRDDGEDDGNRFQEARDAP